MIQPLRYASYAEAQASEIKGTRSATKTRLRLLAALARLLETAEFNALKVIDITQEAGLAKGTFFIYFKTKEDVVAELMETYVEFESATLPQIDVNEEAYHGVRQIIEWYEKSFALNHGILGCLIRLSNSDPQYRRLWQLRNSRLLDACVPLARSRLGIPEAELGLLRKAVHAVGAIMDQAMFERYGLASTVVDQGMELEEMIELHALLIYRAIYGADPPKQYTDLVRPLVEAKLR
jgi:AcrR family transcriptional regulator